MKKVAIPALIALSIGIPSLATAMDGGSIHNAAAQKIFIQLAAESDNGE